MNKSAKRILLLLGVLILIFSLMKLRMIPKDYVGYFVFVNFVVIPVAMFAFASDLLSDLNSSRTFRTKAKRIMERLIASIPYLIASFAVLTFGVSGISVVVSKLFNGEITNETLSLIGVAIMALIFVSIGIYLFSTIIGSGRVHSNPILFRSKFYAESLIDETIGERDFHRWLMEQLALRGLNTEEQLHDNGSFKLLLVVDKAHSEIDFSHLINYPDDVYDEDEDEDYYEDDSEEVISHEQVIFSVQVNSKMFLIRRSKNKDNEILHNKVYKACCELIEANNLIEILDDSL